jgi:hypothetical protein
MFDRASSFKIERPEEQSGAILEQNLLGKPDLGRYKDLVVESLISENLKNRRLNLTAKDIKARNKAEYQELEDVARLEYLKNIRNPILGKKEMFDIIKRSQINQPERPFVTDMKNILVQRLRLESKDIEFYSALGTNADYCGVDGIFTIHRQGHTFDVAVDLTKKPIEEKELDIREKRAAGGKYFSDVIFSFNNNFENNYSPERDAELLDGFKNEIVNHLKKEIREHNEEVERQKKIQAAKE